MLSPSRQARHRASPLHRAGKERPAPLRPSRCEALAEARCWKLSPLTTGGRLASGVQRVRYADAIYVLHAFQKKSKRGIATPRKEMELIRQRLSEAERLHRERQN